MAGIVPANHVYFQQGKKKYLKLVLLCSRITLPLQLKSRVRMKVNPGINQNKDLTQIALSLKNKIKIKNCKHVEVKCYPSLPAYLRQDLITTVPQATSFRSFQGLSCLHLLARCWVYRHVLPCQLYMVLGLRTQVIRLALYLVSHLFSPCTWISTHDCIKTAKTAQAACGFTSISHIRH